MRATSSTQAKTLKQIRRAFSRHRRVSGGKNQHRSATLRRLASFAVEQGLAPVLVAQAAGVSRQAVVNWYRKERSSSRRPKPVAAPPVELKVVKSRPPVPGDAGYQPTIIRILLPGGAVMECPAMALSADLVAILSGASS